MGYFFLVVTLGIINSLASLINLEMLLVANSVLVSMTFLLGRTLQLTHENFQTLNYENLGLIKPAERAELLTDLSERTGYPIHKVQVVKVDYQRGIAQLRVFYFSKENEVIVQKISKIWTAFKIRTVDGNYNLWVFKIIADFSWYYSDEKLHRSIT